MTLLYDLGVCFITISICMVAYFKWKFLYWRRKNVPYIEPYIPFGSIGNPFAGKQSLPVHILRQYHYFKSLGHKYGGVYFFVRPSLILTDLELIKHVFSKDFQYFSDRGSYFNEKTDPLSANLFCLDVHKWRPLRAKLTPTFTSGKLKTMLPFIISCGKSMVNALNKLSFKNEPVDIKDISESFITDVIGSTAFGLDCNSFIESECHLRKHGKQLLDCTSITQIIKLIIIHANPGFAKYLGLSLIPPEPKKFFSEVIKQTVKYRTTNNVVRNDFIQLLMNLKTDKNGNEMTIEQMTAQAFLMWVAGYETSSTTMAFCIYELALNQDIQTKVREEINTVLGKYNDDVTYDAVAEMKYLDQVIDETLRKYPPAASLPRSCVQDYQIPGTDVVVSKGTRITIPCYAIHNDPEYFPNPETFDPSRFDDDKKENIRPFSYMPFGEGPRNCIGIRLGLLQTKVGILLLLKEFRLLFNSKNRLPLQFHSYNIILSAANVMWMDIKKISKD